MKTITEKYRIGIHKTDDHICIFAQSLDLTGKHYVPPPSSYNRSSIRDFYEISYRYDIYEPTFFEKLLGFSNEKRIKMAIKNCEKWIEEKLNNERNK